MKGILNDPYLVALLVLALVINLAALGMKMQRSHEQKEQQANDKGNPTADHARSPE